MPRPLKELRVPHNKALSVEMAFGILLRERRLKLGLSQADLEDEGMDRSYISKLELGKRQIGLKGIILLASKLHTTPWELMKAVVTKVEASNNF